VQFEELRPRGGVTQPRCQRAHTHNYVEYSRVFHVPLRIFRDGGQICEDLDDDINKLPRLVCGAYHPALFIVLQPREELLLSIVQVPRELFIRHKLGTHHLFFMLGSLIPVGHSREGRLLEQVKQILREVVARRKLQPACAAAAGA